MKNRTIRNEQEAQQLIAQLERYYREPVLPLSRFCSTMNAWRECIVKNNTDPALARYANHGHQYYEFLEDVYMDIRKSNLLARLFFGKEPLRTRMCPIHKGHYDGNAMFFNKCPQLCDGTGWLRERPGDAGFTGIKVVEIPEPQIGKRWVQKWFGKP